MLPVRFFFLLLFPVSKAYCQNPIYKNYSVSDGLPSQVVYCSMQDDDGYMWFGTTAGVSRFDGKEFKNFTVKDGLTDNDILKIYKDSKGRLWFLTLKGLLCYYYKGIIHNPANDKAIPTQKAYNGFLSFLEDSNHELWFGGLGGQLAKIPVKGKPEVFNLESSQKLGKAGWVLLYQPEKDRIVLNGITRTYTYNTHDFSEVKNDFSLHEDSVMVYENTSAYQGIVVSYKGIIALNGYEKTTLASSDTLPFLKRTMRIQVDTKQGLWVFTNDRNTWYFEKENGKYRSPRAYFTGQNISGVFIDTEGNRWFSTLGNGIYKVAENQKWVSVLLGGSSYENKPAENILSIFKDHQDKIWLGTEMGKIYSCTEFSDPVEYSRPVEYSSRIVAISESHNGQVHLLADKYIFKVDTGKYNVARKITAVEIVDPATSKNLCFDNDDNLILSTIGGLRKIERNNKDKRSNGELQNIPAQRIYTLCCDYRNRLWFEIFERLYCYDNGKLTSYPQYDSLFTNKITSIVQARDCTLIIASQNNGIFFFKNDKIIGNISQQDGLSGTLCRKVYTEGNNVYVSTNDGFTFFAYDKGKVSGLRSFNSSNGIFPGDINGIVTDEKFIYLATSRGLCRIDKKIQINKTAPPPLKLNFIDTGDTLITEFKDLTFNYYKFNVSVNFTAITFDQPDKIIYQYKLKEGDNWIDSKSNSLSLSELSPGRHTISIRAKKINSDWSNPQTISFLIKPPYWKTVWFQLLIFLAVVILVYYIIKSIMLRKYRLQLAELKARQQIEEERSRIASDMHDDLGADISKISVISEVIKVDKNISKANAINIQKVSLYAKELRKKMDDIIWALNPSNDKLIDFVAHIRELAASLMEESKITCEVNVKEFSNDIVLSTLLRRNLFLIIKEAMNNTLKHARAENSYINIAVESNKLILEISDNGSGFDVNNKNMHGNGINNMVKRVAQVNGTHFICAKVNEGTIIKITIPL